MHHPSNMYKQQNQEVVLSLHSHKVHLLALFIFSQSKMTNFLTSTNEIPTFSYI